MRAYSHGSGRSALSGSGISAPTEPTAALCRELDGRITSSWNVGASGCTAESAEMNARIASSATCSLTFSPPVLLCPMEHRPARGGVDVAGPVAEPYRLALNGDWDAAARWWKDHGCRYEAAIALTAGDDPDAARTAIEALDRLGARAAAARARRRLRELGVTSVPRGAAPVDPGEPGRPDRPVRGGRPVQIVVTEMLLITQEALTPTVDRVSSRWIALATFTWATQMAKSKPTGSDGVVGL